MSIVEEERRRDDVPERAAKQPEQRGCRSQLVVDVIPMLNISTVYVPFGKLSRTRSRVYSADFARKYSLESY